MTACQTITPAALLLSTALTQVEPLYYFTPVSSNGKVGPIPVTTSPRQSCPTACPFSAREAGKAKLCYGGNGPLDILWGQISAGTKGISYADLCAKVAALPAGQLWRHDQAGDIKHAAQVIDRPALAALVAANTGKRGYTYTHHDMTIPANRDAIREALAGGFVINLSGNSPAHADTLAALVPGAPVVTTLPKAYGRRVKGKDWAETLAEYKARVAALPPLVTPEGRKIAACPATYLDTNCAACGLCARAGRAVIVGFPAHGTGAAAVDVMAWAGLAAPAMAAE